MRIWRDSAVRNLSRRLSVHVSVPSWNSKGTVDFQFGKALSEQMAMKKVCVHLFRARILVHEVRRPRSRLESSFMKYNPEIQNLSLLLSPIATIASGVQMRNGDATQTLGRQADLRTPSRSISVRNSAFEWTIVLLATLLVLPAKIRRPNWRHQCFTEAPGAHISLAAAQRQLCVSRTGDM
jgi:hypothetical protein